MSSILAPFYEAAARHPDRLLYVFLDIEGRVTESYTYAQFLERTTDVAEHIRRAHAMHPGERVLLAYPPGVEMICGFFACVRLGLIPVPVYPPTSHGFQAALAKTEFIARDCDASAILTSRSYYWSMRVHEARAAVANFSLRRSALSRVNWIVTTEARRGVRADFTDQHSDVLFLQYTSGSTREPRGVMVTHANILANCDAVVDHLPIGVTWLPQYHDMGLIGYYLFFALKGGTTYGFSPLDFIRRPALWFETITRYRGTASSAPNFAYAYCLRLDRIPDSALQHYDLSSLRFLMNAAEPVQAHVCEDFVRRFAACGLDPSSFFSAYGLAEFTLAVSNYGRTIRSFDRAALQQHRVRPPAAGANDTDTTTLVSCGRVLGDAQVSIVDTTQDPRKARVGEVGEIWIRGSSKCGGYWQRPDLTRAVFEAQLPAGPEHTTWLRSGDMGFIQDGELYLCGRLKDMVIMRGQNYYPQDIEAVVESDDCVRRGCVAAFAHELDGREALVVVAELKQDRNVPDSRVLNQRLVQAVGIAASSFVFIRARTIPKTSSGKIARHVVRGRWRDGRLDVLADFDMDPDIAHATARGPRAWLRRFGLTGDEPWTLADAGLDSLGLVEFAEALKQQLEDHGDDELAAAVDLRVLQRIAICELMDLVDQVLSAAPHARLRLQRALGDLGRKHRAEEAVSMRQDACLPFDAPALHASRARATSTSGVVLLTGATGFFGPFLLTSLLEQLREDIVILVRPSVHGDDAMARVRKSLATLGAGAPDREGWEQRVRLVHGDLAAPNLGLDSSTWRQLAEQVHTIYHNGALVNYLLDYQAMRGANVAGTSEVVRLAMDHRAKVLNYISTTFIFGWSVQQTLGEGDTNSAMDRLDFGYSQSKWVAEEVVRDGMRRGLDARIFRPALLAPSLHDGGHNFDIAIRLLSFMINHGLSTTAGNQVSFTPADLAANNIVAISRLPESVGTTFHVTRDDYASMSDITTIVASLTGQTFTTYPLRDFVPEVIRRCHSGDILFPLLDFLTRSVDNITAMEFKRYDNSNYRHFRDLSPDARPDPPLHDVVHGMLRFMRRHRLVSTRALVPQ